MWCFHAAISGHWPYLLNESQAASASACAAVAAAAVENMPLDT
jgi:hypothetical protein